LAPKEERLHRGHWAEVNDLLVDERLEEAVQLLAQHVKLEPAYPAAPGA
jgi:protein involved in temperature-dependent protein secretion